MFYMSKGYSIVEARKKAIERIEFENEVDKINIAEAPKKVDL